MKGDFQPKGRKGRPNKDNAKLTSQILSLINKWKD
jgi:hypothetical protein